MDLSIVWENWEAIASLVVFLLCLAGYKVRAKLLSFDRERRLVKGLMVAHRILERIAPKTATKIDDYVDDILIIAIDILENKDELVVLTTNDKKKLKDMAVKLGRKALQKQDGS